MTQVINTNTLPVFWWNGRPNFGDLLTTFIFSTCLGKHIRWVPPDDAGLFGIGSILEHLPSDSDVKIYGSGFQYSHSRNRIENERILAVRGALSASSLGLNPDNLILGDPGLLIEPISKQRVTAKLGLIPHYVDKLDTRIRKIAAANRGQVKIIDVEQRCVRNVVQEIGQCEYILSSSLHGIVAAWALGKPASWIELSDGVLGNGFKFRDFYSSFGLMAKARNISGHESLVELQQWCEVPNDSDLIESKRKLKDAFLSFQLQ